jgi:hypothetical protein
MGLGFILAPLDDLLAIALGATSLFFRAHLANGLVAFSIVNQVRLN